MMMVRKSYLLVLCLFALFYLGASCNSNKSTTDCQSSISTTSSTHRIPSSSGIPPTYQCRPTKMNGEPEPEIIGAGVLLMVGGLYLSTLGFAFFRPTMFIFGCFIGSFVAWVALQYGEPVDGYSHCYPMYLGVCLGSGVVVGITFMFVYQPVIFLLGLSSGTLLVTYIFCWRSDFLDVTYYMRWVIHAICLGISFVLTLYCEFAMMVFALSFIGGYAFMLGLDMMIQKGFQVGFEIVWDFNKNHHSPSYKLNHLDKRFIPGEYRLELPTYWLLGSIIGWVLLFGIWQWWFNKGNRFGVRIIRNSNDTLAKIK